jgi:hypothetical protein
MTTAHPPIQFFAGDDWEIQATLLDEEGVPYDLTQGSPVIKWRLMDFRYVAIIGDEAIITFLNAPNGLVSIKIAGSVTTILNTGLYSDALRLVMGGESGTLLGGPIAVVADPWAFPEGIQMSNKRARVTYSRGQFRNL